MASNVKVDKITPTTNCGTVTLGDSGDTISIPSGASLSIGGSVSGIDGIVNWDTTAKTTAFTAVAGTGYFVNTTSAAITVTLPASPTAGDLVAVKDYAFTADTNNITLARNGSNIQGAANNFVINTEGRSVTLIYVDATQGWLLTGASQKTDIAEEPLYVTATGGTITTSGDYKIHTFTGPGTFCVSCAGNACGSSTVDYLVIAGGGMGGSLGGGGAGGYRESSGAASGCYTRSPLGACVAALPVTATGYPVTVGAGGAGFLAPQPESIKNPGSNSVFSTITSAGGGSGGHSGNPTTAVGDAGGSGGGSGGSDSGSGSGGSGNTPPVSPPQGGNGGGTAPTPGTQFWGGGGGGASGNGGSPGTPTVGGPGAAGVTSSINASPVTRAGGGGGGSYLYPGGGGSGGTGGSGGGGNGGYSAPGSFGTDGTANTGGGGGGRGVNPAGSGNPTSGAGGSGIVIIRYKYQ